MFFIQLEVVGRGGCVRILLVFMPLMISLELSWSFFPQTPRPDLDLPNFRGADFNWCEQIAFKVFFTDHCNYTSITEKKKKPTHPHCKVTSLQVGKKSCGVGLGETTKIKL